jgi:hypothetical protein
VRQRAAVTPGLDFDAAIDVLFLNLLPGPFDAPVSSL